MPSNPGPGNPLIWRVFLNMREAPASRGRGAGVDYESAAHPEVGPADVVAGLEVGAGAGEGDAAGFHDVGLLGYL
jgi:hypothetical protein